MSRKRIKEIALELLDLAGAKQAYKDALRRKIESEGDEFLCEALFCGASACSATLTDPVTALGIAQRNTHTAAEALLGALGVLDTVPPPPPSSSVS